MSPPPQRAVDEQVYPSTTVAEPGAMAEALVRHARDAGYAKRLYLIRDRRPPGAERRGAARAWWIAPERRQPVYRHGKIVVASWRGRPAPRGGGVPGRRGGTTLFVGLCVHKGLDPRAAKSLPAPRWGRGWIMTAQPLWVWEDFLPEMAAGHIDPLAAKAEESGGFPLSVLLRARDPGGEDRDEAIAFEWSRGELTPSASPHRRARGHLRAFSSAGTLPTLGRRLRYAPRCEGLWLELAIGFQLRVNRLGSAAATWDEHRIWESACRPWSLWLR